MANDCVMRSAFITGGSGFIGGAVIRHLRSASIQVSALARSHDAARKIRDCGAQAIAGDLSDETALMQGMRNCDVVFHAAANAQDHDRERAMED